MPNERRRLASNRRRHASPLTYIGSFRSFAESRNLDPKEVPAHEGLQSVSLQLALANRNGTPCLRVWRLAYAGVQ